MRRKIIASLLVTATIVAMLAGAVVFRGIAAGTESYTATVKYYDSVMLTYNLYYPSGGVWGGSGDVPLGGAGISSQIYCADPFVAFHSMAETTWEGTTTDRVDGYVAAAPWAVSGAMLQNDDAVRWLVLNGYRGDFLGDDSESRESVARLQGLYPGLGEIDKTIALMATKVSIWKTLAGDNVEIIRTSLDPAREAVFFALVDAMVSDAAWGTPTGEIMTEFSLSIREIKSEIVEGAEHTYVPLTVTAQLENTGGGAGLDGVFLTVSGPDIDDITFVDGPEEGSAELPYGVIYGTDQNAQFLEGGGFAQTGGEWTWEGDVYLRIPADRAPDYGDMLTIRAMARAGSVAVYPGTPVTLVYGGGGYQDWNYVQAFIGAACDGMTADLFAEASVYTGSTALGSLCVQKMLENNAPTDEDTEFSFAVYYNPAGNDFSAATRLDLNAHPVRAAVNVNSSVAGEHYFTLRNGGQAYIDGIPSEYFYWVVELEPVSGYLTPEYAVPAAASSIDRGQAIPADQGFRTNSFLMSSGAASVVFYNSKGILVTGSLTDENAEENTDEDTDEETEENKDEDAEEDTDEDAEDTDESTTFNTVVSAGLNAHLRIGKIAIGLVEGGDEMTNVRGVEFEYTLQFRESPSGNWRSVNLSDRFSTGVSAQAPDGEFGGGRLINAAGGRFVLNHYGEAYIELDPAYEYRVIEGADPDYASAYAFGIYENGSWRALTGGPVNAYWKDKGLERITDGFRVSPDGYYRIVFTNVDIPCHDLTIGKTAEGQDDSDELFRFEVVYTGGGLGAEFPWTVPLTTDPGVYEAILVTGNDGLSLDGRITDGTVLSLRSGESATLSDLFTGHFIVREIAEDGYSASYSIDGGDLTPAIAGETEGIHLTSDVRVDFVNAAVVAAGAENESDSLGDEADDEYEADDLSDESEDSEEFFDDGFDLGNGGTPAWGLSPQTGDERDPMDAIYMLLLGIGCIVIAEIYRKRVKKSEIPGGK